MSKIGPRFKYLEQPIFCLCVLKDYVLVASGGGGKKFGVRNKIVSYRIIQDAKLSDDVCHSAEYEKEIPVFISKYEPLNIFCTCIDNHTVFYSLDISNGVFNELCRLKVMEFFDADIYQSVCRFDNKGKYFASGTTDGNLKVYELNATNSSVSPKFLKESQAHIKGINDILFIDEKNLILSAGADGQCKIFEATSLKLLKKLSMRKSVEEKHNYSFKGLVYDKQGGFLYSIQAPLRGYTFLTKWDAKNNFTPINSIEISDSICTSIDYSPRFDLLAMADCKGSLIYVDPSGASGQMSKIKEVFLSEITLKSIAFKNENLVSGAADNALQLNYIYKPSLIRFTFVFKILFLVIFAYYLFLRFSNKI